MTKACDYCKQEANELTQKPDWPSPPGSNRAAWVCDSCLQQVTMMALMSLVHGTGFKS